MWIPYVIPKGISSLEMHTTCICYSVFRTAALLSFEKRMLAFLKPFFPFLLYESVFLKESKFNPPAALQCLSV